MCDPDPATYRPRFGAHSGPGRAQERMGGWAYESRIVELTIILTSQMVILMEVNVARDPFTCDNLGMRNASRVSGS